MKIGIDGRLIQETGVGRYIRNLVTELGRIDRTHTYILFLRKKDYEDITLPNKRWVKRLADVPWHSVAEQLFMPAMYAREHLDLLHVPYFNIPLLYFGKFIVTIHDLTILHFDTGKASTLPYLFYKLRRIGYHLELMKALSWSEHVIAVSKATKQEITDHFDITPKNISVTHEGVDDALRVAIAGGRVIDTPYFLYVGNAYPHKNLNTLIDAFALIQSDCKLVLVGKDDYFYRRLKDSSAVVALKERIIFKIVSSDRELANLYHHAQAFVFPSVMEGFGLPALEALALGCPVIVSDIPVFHELLADAPVYFDPKNIDELTRHMKHALTHPLRTKSFQEKAEAVAKKYSWQRMAKETLAVYEASI